MLKNIGGSKDNSVSIDRIDNNRGYVYDNIVIVSMLANRIKNSATPDQIISVGEFYKRLLESKIPTAECATKIRI